MFLETICIVDGIVLNVKAHEERMQQTAAHFGFKVPTLSAFPGGLPEQNKSWQGSGQESWLESGLGYWQGSGQDVGRSKLELDAGARTKHGSPPLKVKCRVIYRETIQEITFEHYLPRKVESLKLIEASPDYAFKFADRTSLNALLARRGDCDEILITRNGLITDTSYSNVVFSKGGRLFTPSEPLLNGTKRQQLLREGKIEEKEIAVDILEQYDRIYLINAMLDIEDGISLPVSGILQ